MARWDTPENRFWGRVTKTDSCWLWARPHSNGYGYITVNGKKYLAHRLSYVWANGPVPEGLELDHLCRVRSCVNPAHLEAVTSKENTLRGKVSALRPERTHCRRGHSLAEHGRERLKKGRDNPYTWCVLCNKIDCAAKYQERKDSASKNTTAKEVK